MARRGWMVALGTAAALALAGGAAFAAGGGHATAPGRWSPQAFWSAVAAKVGVPASTLEAAVRAVRQQERGTGVLPPFARGRWHGMGPARGAAGALLKTAANYLGITPRQLLTDLRQGQSLAQVATASGKSVSGLEAALTAQASQLIDRLVTTPWAAPSGPGA
jgi:hypothetical protein